MSQSTDLEFGRRLQRITRRSDRIRQNGRRFVMQRDGLVVQKPRRVRPRFPLAGLLTTAAALFGFKVFLYLHLGAEAFGARIDALSSGGAAERVAAWVMQADPVTVRIAEALAQVL